MGSAPSLLSMVSVTSARPRAGRPEVPANTTSSILPPRSGLAPCSPITQENASTTFDLPDPFGPTTQVIPGSKRSDVAEANDLNPRKVRVFRYTRGFSPPQPPHAGPVATSSMRSRQGSADASRRVRAPAVRPRQRLSGTGQPLAPYREPGPIPGIGGAGRPAGCPRGRRALTLYFIVYDHARHCWALIKRHL